MRSDTHELIKQITGNESLQDTDDWEVASRGVVTGGWGLGVGAFKFGFRSLSLKQYLRVAFVGGGLAGGVVAGVTRDPSVVDPSCSSIKWTALKNNIREPFSAANLCSARGRVSIAAIGTSGRVGLSASILVITADYSGARRQGLLFDKAHVYSLGDPGSGGVGASVLWGKWVYLGAPDVLDWEWTRPCCSRI